ncbi:MAG: hypothetical protein CTY31_06300 [Hyphomicrobium sp.]|nr:MAG: hypothetical protein CTY39_11185 [Hyphomicrobium sp.]PPD00689.1 MAG: hypothetical protein CTY31_06300 [Hyphomicrobium sp.]
MAPRELFSDVPYICSDFELGFALEDWLWNIQTIYAGWKHEIVKDTIIFKRRRDMSLVVKSSQRRTILWPVEALAIDEIAKLR